MSLSANEIIGIATVFVAALTGLVTTITKLFKSLNEARLEIGKLRQGVLSSNIAITQLNQRTPEIEKSHVKPDPSLVYKWAQDHRAANPYDMGPRNWERCLYDLEYPGGKPNELVFEEKGSLAYQ